MDGVVTRWCNVPVWVHIMGINVDVFSDGSDCARVKGSFGYVPCALLLGIGQMCVLPRCWVGGSVGGLVKLVLEVAAAFMSQHGS